MQNSQLRSQWHIEDGSALAIRSMRIGTSASNGQNSNSLPLGRIGNGKSDSAVCGEYASFYRRFDATRIKLQPKFEFESAHGAITSKNWSHSSATGLPVYAWARHPK